MPANKRAIRSDLARLDATTDEDIARQIAEDPDTAPDLSDVPLLPPRKRAGRPRLGPKKVAISIRLGEDVLEHYKADGPGWQSRIEATLRDAVRKGAA